MDQSTQTYIDLLEKTNQQLSLWGNPYAIMVMVLTVLVALLAIGVTYLLWTQKREYRELFNSFLKKQEKILQGQISNTKDLLDKHISESKEKVKSLKGKDREEIEEEIKKMKQTRRQLEMYSAPTTIGALGSNSNDSPLKLRLDDEPTVVTLNQNLNTDKIKMDSLLMQRHCGRHLPPDSSFCPYCGLSL
ncbi:MAG: hypothetical protein WDZ80_06310 [Candidatus Paceibacterota bacterium]